MSNLAIHSLAAVSSAGILFTQNRENARIGVWTRPDGLGYATTGSTSPVIASR